MRDKAGIHRTRSGTTVSRLTDKNIHDVVAYLETLK